MRAKSDTIRGGAREILSSRSLPAYKSKALVVIPARYGSTRFQGKPLARIGGLPMIVQVMNRAAKIRNADAVVVATDDERIKAAVEEAGGTAIMTAHSHPTGTSRVSEAASWFLHGIVVNVQGDEPMLPIRPVEDLIDAMRADPMLMMGTLASPSTDLDDWLSPDVVKVVCDRDGNALYFSRSPLPYAESRVHGRGRKRNAASFLRHIGVYAFRRAFLLSYNDLPHGPLEKLERLEQLRALESGYRVRVIVCRSSAIGVDRPEDVKRVEKRLRSR